MGGIYAGSAVTIAADANTSVNEGILDLAENKGEEDITGSVRIVSALENGKESTLVFYNIFASHIGSIWTPRATLNSPLSKRALCLQERMLSARTLHFTRKGTIWECRELYFSFPRCSAYEAMTNVKTLASILQIFSDRVPISHRGPNKGMKILGADAEKLTDDQLYMINSMLETLHTSKLYVCDQPTGSDWASWPEDKSEAVAWWNTAVVAPYSGRPLHIFQIGYRRSQVWPGFLRGIYKLHIYQGYGSLSSMSAWNGGRLVSRSKTRSCRNTHHFHG